MFFRGPNLSNKHSPKISNISSNKFTPRIFDDVHSKYFSSESSTAYKIPEMPYDYRELEPAISGEIMEIHHKKHHQAYVNNLNIALDKYQAALKSNNLSEQIALQPSIRFNGGGHLNHSIFWTNLAPIKKGGGAPPTGELLQRIQKQWGSVDNFISKFNSTVVGVQGSGWGWLAYNKETDGISIVTLPNQDPVSTLGLIPLLGIDVWEHAYYLQYKNARPDYLKAIWQVVNWNNVQERFESARKK